MGSGRAGRAIGCLFGDLGRKDADADTFVVEGLAEFTGSGFKDGLYVEAAPDFGGDTVQNTFAAGQPASFFDKLAVYDDGTGLGSQ